MKTFSVILFFISCILTIGGLGLFLEGLIKGEIEKVRTGTYILVPSVTVMVYVILAEEKMEN